jgi:ParB family chromosome partitioning protein
MATSVQKITLSSSRDIPLNLLVLSQSNVRRTKAGVSLEELAADIGRRGLLQSLNVRPVLDEAGAETGTYEVPAGGRRFRALELLVKQKRLAKTAPVPCVVRDPASPILAEDDSLAENIHRAPLHPLDQFRAFQTMLEKGQSEEEIAAAFFTNIATVKQRLRLAAVSEKLLAIYAEDGMKLEQLMAFTVTDDHARQEQVWEALEKSWSKEPYQIRRMLTEKTVQASDRRVRFVGIEAYKAAGGIVMRDLFQADNGGWLDDVGLLERLVAEKLKADAEAIATEGWKWIEVDSEFPYGHASRLRALDGKQLELTQEEQAEIEALQAEYQKLEAEYADADELPEEVGDRLEAIEARLTAFDERPAFFATAEMARAGAFVSIGSDGSLLVDRGYVRPEDELPAGVDGETGEILADDDAGTSESGTPAIQRAVITIGNQAAEPEDEEGDTIRPLPDRLVAELTAHRTLALRDAVANRPDVAMTLLLHKLCCDLFLSGNYGTCIEASVRTVFFPMQAAGLKDSPSAKSVDERHEAWKAEVPKADDALWDWLVALDEASRQALLAHCIAFGVNALFEKVNPYGGGLSASGLERRMAQADRLGMAVGLDMVEAGWQPTVDNYLGRVTKPRILEAVREAKGEAAAQLIDHLKKGDMAKEAERLLEGTGWLPEPLRGGIEESVAEESSPVGQLPDFLAGDGGELDDATHDPVTALAAE